MDGIKDRLKALNKTQVWLILRLRKIGICVTPQEMSSVLSGALVTPKATRIKKECDLILSELEGN